uniref:Uncharacterized protein n=1 Tax=Anguilla anguilla TaxID=7936 RepID=A0A0E9TB55_ANGAN
MDHMEPAKDNALFYKPVNSMYLLGTGITRNSQSALKTIFQAVRYRAHPVNPIMNLFDLTVSLHI